ncbi:MAG TPA: hypothetical protein PL048_10390 [Leptospiraceae bacterium]|nr:hypothetical protein [Leptospiraceae bacterium]HMZ59175.1 hypothetical protein [Leptospiraceae bacterium]HNF24294.1 hypothetical protein [Leptospiraceae bacterium]HNI95114.1 hypothetical protein [Leptospiraceae bacterium]HNM06311.1 hypothetical protein [Leptospiraceae bacterium]
MKHLFNLFIITVSIVNCVSFKDKDNPGGDSGKTRNYFNDRIMDSRDIFTFTAVYGGVAGVKGQIGPLGAGLYLQPGSLGHGLQLSNETGLKSGEMAYHHVSDFAILIGTDSSSPELEKGARSEIRDKDYKSAFRHPPSYTRLGFAAALGIGLRVEINAGELLDFLLGFALIDIYDDDIYLKNQKP